MEVTYSVLTGKRRSYVLDSSNPDMTCRIASETGSYTYREYDEVSADGTPMRVVAVHHATRGDVLSCWSWDQPPLTGMVGGLPVTARPLGPGKPCKHGAYGDMATWSISDPIGHLGNFCDRHMRVEYPELQEA
jgi:hypothetical protein